MIADPEGPPSSLAQLGIARYRRRASVSHDPQRTCAASTIPMRLMLANDGAWKGRQIIPRDWVREATTVAADRPHLAPRNATPYFRYGSGLAATRSQTHL
jgi:hypothetical protein